MFLTPKGRNERLSDRATHQRRCTDAGKTGQMLVPNVGGSIEVCIELIATGATRIVRAFMQLYPITTVGRKSFRSNGIKARGRVLKGGLEALRLLWRRIELYKEDLLPPHAWKGRGIRRSKSDEMRGPITEVFTALVQTFRTGARMV